MTAQVYFLMIAVLLCLSGYLSTTDATQTAKPGECPPEKLVGGCAKSCTCDTKCPDKKMCCSNGCGRCCTAPYTVKPGQCPKPKKIPASAKRCSYDGQCPAKQKCCPTTSGHACSKPQ